MSQTSNTKGLHLGADGVPLFAKLPGRKFVIAWRGLTGKIEAARVHTEGLTHHLLASGWDLPRIDRVLRDGDYPRVGSIQEFVGACAAASEVSP